MDKNNSAVTPETNTWTMDRRVWLFTIKTLKWSILILLCWTAVYTILLGAHNQFWAKFTVSFVRDHPLPEAFQTYLPFQTAIFNSTFNGVALDAGNIMTGCTTWPFKMVALPYLSACKPYRKLPPMNLEQLSKQFVNVSISLGESMIDFKREAPGERGMPFKLSRVRSIQFQHRTQQPIKEEVMEAMRHYLELLKVAEQIVIRSHTLFDEHERAITKLDLGHKYNCDETGFPINLEGPFRGPLGDLTFIYVSQLYDIQQQCNKWKDFVESSKRQLAEVAFNYNLILSTRGTTKALVEFGTYDEVERGFDDLLDVLQLHSALDRSSRNITDLCLQPSYLWTRFLRGDHVDIFKIPCKSMRATMSHGAVHLRKLMKRQWSYDRSRIELSPLPASRTSVRP